MNETDQSKGVSARQKHIHDYIQLIDRRVCACVFVRVELTSVARAFFVCTVNRLYTVDRSRRNVHKQPEHLNNQPTNQPTDHSLIGIRCALSIKLKFLY